jgi:hypothetical protein
VAVSTPKPARVVLSPELSSFLVEFSIALQKHAIYPEGHPSLGPAAMRLTALAARLMQDRPTLAFGVARHQLIIDGVATDPAQPVLRRLAETLHQHHLGAISLLPGVEDQEMSGALETLANEVGPDVTPLGLVSPGLLPTWPHLRLHPLTLERLELVDDEPGAPQGADAQAVRRQAQLWIGLANAALSRDSSSPPADAAPADSGPPDPTVVAKAIDDHDGAAAYDQVIVGYLLQIADELKSAPAADQGALRRRTSRLIGALRPDTLQRLVTMGGNVAQRRAFVLGATSGMAVESVVTILKAAAEASGQTISHGLVRMLSKLATHAESGQAQTKPVADRALREQVERLLSGWNLADPAPTSYVQTLQHLATGVGPEKTRPAKAGAYDIDDMHIVRTCLEVGASGPMVERAIGRAIDAGHVHSLQTLLSFLPPDRPTAAAETLRQRLGGARAMAVLVAAEPLDTRTLDGLLPHLSHDGYEVLLDTLIASESRATRRKLLERLAPIHLDVAPLIADRLRDERWYVQRNLLLLLQRLGQVPAEFSASQWTQHRDARVRYQSIALQLTLPHERQSALRAALEDKDERVAQLGLVAAQDTCPHSLIPLVAHFATNSRVREDLRIHAVKALARTRDRYARDTLMRLVHSGGAGGFFRPKLAPTPVVQATLRALSDFWPADAEVRQVLGTKAVRV